MLRLLGLATVVVLAAVGSAAAEAVAGYVVEAGSGARCPTVEVAFLAIQDGRRVAVLSKVTDEQGRFSFTGPFIAPGMPFALEARYRGVPFPSSDLRVGEQSEVVLEVYEPTGDDSAIRFRSHHLFLTLTEEGLEGAQFAEVENTGTHAFVGIEGEEGRQVTAFALPPSAFGVRGEAGAWSEGSAGLWYDPQPLTPGRTQISFTFELDPRELPGQYLHQVRYPTDLFEVFLSPTDLQAGAPFVDLGVVTIQQRTYRRLRLERLAPGQTVRIPLPISRSLRWVLKWAALIAVVPVGGVVFWVARRPGRLAEPRADLERQRGELVRQLAQLEDSYADRQDDPWYRTEWERLMSQAAAVYLLLEGQDERR